MNDALLVLIATLISLGVTQGLIWWTTKRTLPSQIKKTETETKRETAETRLTEGGLAEKYHSLANLQADENIELTSQNMELKKQLDDQNIEHKRGMEELRTQMLELDRKHLAKEEELETRLNIEVKKREAAEAYIERVIYQLKSWEITPVPYSISEWKELKKFCIEGPEITSRV